MPELPEVETVVRQLRPLVGGRPVRRLEAVDPLLGALPVRLAVDRRIQQVVRVGKQVVLALHLARARSTRGAGKVERRPATDTTVWLGVHLRMTGRLLWWSEEQGPEPAHVRARLWLAGGRLLFADVRRLGTIRLTKDRAALQPAGVDPLERAFTGELLAGWLACCGQAIKVWLLRQDRIAGLGNIYASEILFEAGIDPRRLASTLTAVEVAHLHRSIRSVLRRAIDNCGTTFSDFQDARGLTGSYQHYLRVYGRQGQPCTVCRSPIARVVQQQRSTFYCPSCQSAAIRLW